MKTVIELGTFSRLVEGRLAREDHDALVSFVAFHPAAGELIPGSGGARKLLGGERA